MKNDEYLAEAQKTLFAFQMLEEALKIRIGLFYERNETSKPQNFDVKKLMDTPLGPLIKMYEKAFGDKLLVTEMRSALGWRNYCAHNIYVHWLYSATSASPYTAHTIDDLCNVKNFTVDLVQRIGKEIETLKLQSSELPQIMCQLSESLPSLVVSK